MKESDTFAVVGAVAVVIVIVAPCITFALHELTPKTTAHALPKGNATSWSFTP